MDEYISRQDAIDALNNHLDTIPLVNNTDAEMIRRDEIIDCRDIIQRLPSAQEEKWISEIREAYARALANPYIRKPLSRALYEVWHRYDAIKVERR